MPITTSRPSKVECGTLVEKIIGKILMWSSRNISYAGRLVLVNIVLFDMFNLDFHHPTRQCGSNHKNMQKLPMGGRGRVQKGPIRSLGHNM